MACSSSRPPGGARRARFAIAGAARCQPFVLCNTSRTCLVPAEPIRVDESGDGRAAGAVATEGAVKSAVPTSGCEPCHG